MTGAWAEFFFILTVACVEVNVERKKMRYILFICLCCKYRLNERRNV